MPPRHLSSLLRILSRRTSKPNREATASLLRRGAGIIDREAFDNAQYAAVFTVFEHLEDHIASPRLSSRELPRMRQFALDRKKSYGGYGPRPTQFTLGSGHMSYFLPFGGGFILFLNGMIIHLMRVCLTRVLVHCFKSGLFCVCLR